MHLDVSAAVEIVMQRDNAQNISRQSTQADWVITPDLFRSEISNAVGKYYKATLLSHEECVQNVEDSIMMIDDFFNSKDLWREALAEGIKNRHPVYDMFYVVLVRRNDGKIISNDKKVKELCKKLK
ncbi:MAG: type II toxin-antitoxin system VapC family toxin [Spirochaetota bacterium]